MANAPGSYQLPDDEVQKPQAVEPREVNTQLPDEQDIGSSLEQNFQFFWRSVTRSKYWIIAASVAVSILVFIYCKMQKPLYQAETKVLIEPATGEAEEIVGFAQRRWWLESDILTEKDVIQSRVVMERVVQNLGLTQIDPFKNAPDPAGALLQMTKVEASTKSRALRVRLIFGDPVLTAKMVNEVLNAYIQISEEKAKGWIMRTVDQMRNEVTRLKQQLDQDQQKLKQYEIEHPQIASKDTLEEQVKHLNTELSTVSGERLKLRTELEELAAFQRQGADVRDHPKVAKDPSIEQTLTVLQQKEVELTQLLGIYKEQFPIVVEKRAELETLRRILNQRKGQIVEDMKSKYILITTRESELRKTAQRTSEELSKLLGDLGGYEALQGQVEVSKNLYALVLERMDKASIVGRSEQSKVKVLSRAEVPRAPYSPQTKRNVSLAFLISLAVMSYLAYLYFLMLKPIESEDEISQGTKIPVLTELPYLKEPKEGESHLLVNQTEGFGKDRLHFLRSALMASDQRIFVFTSANPAEGKTFVVHNLGVYLAREGVRVLLVGTDFRDLRLKARLQIEVGEKSIENYLAGKHSLENLIHPSAEPGLFYLGAEKIVKNSLEVLTSAKFRNLVQQLQARFDLVLFDSPPIKLFPDALILAELVKNVIFIVRYGKTPYRDLHKAVKSFQKMGIHVTGAILNGKTLGWQHYYYYNYYYGKSGRTPVLRNAFHRINRYTNQILEVIERRRFKRVQTELPIEFVLIGPEGKQYPIMGVVTNLGQGGALANCQKNGAFHTEADLRKANKELDMKIKLQSGEFIQVKGSVRRAFFHRDHMSLRIQFSEISDSDSGKLKSLLENF